MKKIIVLVLIALAHSSFAEEKQFPDTGHIYKPGKDTGFSQYMTKSLKGTKKVALTFDDGPDLVLTPKLLDTLKKYDVKATFFMLTDRITPEILPIVKRMIEEGHNIASHHTDHTNNNTRDEASYRAGLNQSILKIASTMEEENSIHREVYYRFPYGLYGSGSRPYHHLNVMKEVSNDLFGDNCINFAFWDIDTVDWLEDMTPTEIAQNVMSNIFGGGAFDFKQKSNGDYYKIKYNITKPLGGGVVLMHDVHARSVDAVPKLLEQFKEKGVEVLPLQDIEEYAYHGKACRLKN